jgi:putative flippase GtrA
MQTMVLRVYTGPFTLTAALFMGTGTGLVCKYLWDKTWIFHDRAIGLAAHGSAFSPYTATGVVAIGIFWGSEYGFDALSTDGYLCLVGGAIRMMIGSVTKFQLDRRFLFDAATA